MVLKLYGIHASTCTQRVAVVLHEKKVPFEFIIVDWAKGEHKSPEYLEKQPFGQVPYINDDGFILSESRAICRYIEAKYPNQGTKLIPTDIQKRALFEQAASIEIANFDVYASGAAYEALFKQYSGRKTDEERLKELLTTLEAKLQVYDKVLAKQKYLAGDEVTLADLFHLPTGILLPASGSNVLMELPNVKRWFNDLQSRPAWKVVRDEFPAGP